MKAIVKSGAVLSLAACLTVAVLRFLDLASYSTYTMVLGIFSILYFIAAITWSEMRR